MDDWVWIVVAVAVVVVLALVVAALAKRRKHKELQDRFGSEYDRTVERTGDRKSAEADLRERSERRDALDLRPLRPEVRDRYRERWTEVQARFVDQPDTAVSEADGLVAEVMRDRGYPVDDFEEQAELVSVDHPEVVEDYRAAHEIHERNEQRLASTDDLRTALLHYRSLFDRLLVAEDDDRAGSDVDDRAAVDRRD